jgi:hypothetical protein
VTKLYFAREVATPAGVARVGHGFFLCLPSSVEVEAAIHGYNGMLAGARGGI